MKKLLVSLLVIVCMCFAFVGCDRAPSQGAVPDKDRAGNTITIPEEINRIISLAPSATEALAEFGLKDKIVAVTTVDLEEGLFENVIKVDMMNLAVEPLLELDADLLITSNLVYQGDSSSNLLKPLQDLGVCIAVIPTANTFEDIYKDYEFYGWLLDKRKEADVIVQNLKREIEAIQDIASTITQKKSIYFEISAAPYMYTTVEGTYLDEMIKTIGATNAAAKAEGAKDGWLGISEEVVLSLNPDVIMTNVTYLPDPVGEIKGRNGWDVVNAIKNNEVYKVDNEATSLPNHNIIKGLKEMAKAVYPEYYNL